MRDPVPMPQLRLLSSGLVAGCRRAPIWFGSTMAVGCQKSIVRADSDNTADNTAALSCLFPLELISKRRGAGLRWGTFTAGSLFSL